MSLSGNFPEDGDAVEVEEIPIWRETIPEGNYWGEEGRNYLLTLTKEQVIWMLQRIPRAKRDYLDAVNPSRTDYTELVNLPMVDQFNGDKMSAGVRRTPQSIKFLWETSRGVCPFPY